MAESRIHQCQSGHFHVFEPGITPSWPFWSRHEALVLLGAWLWHHVIDPAEAYRLSQESRRLNKIRLRDAHGNFTGRLLPYQATHGIDHQSLVENWIQFFLGNVPDMVIIDRKPYLDGRPVPMLGPIVVSLSCDFIRREEERAKPLRSLEVT